MAPAPTVRLDDVMARLDFLDQQERRIPPAEGVNDLMIASSDGDVWLWVRAQGRDDGGADVMIDPARLRNALGGGNAVAPPKSDKPESNQVA